MAKKVITLIKLQIPGGQANPAPPVGPALGQHGVNIMEFCKAFNAQTAQENGRIIPVEITVYEDRSFDFITKTPPAAVLIKEALRLDKGSAEPNRTKVGRLTQGSAALDRRDEARRSERARRRPGDEGHRRHGALDGSGGGAMSAAREAVCDGARPRSIARRLYSPAEAVRLLKAAQAAKFDETVEVHFNLGLNVRHADEQLRGTLMLPNGTGKEARVAVFAEGEKAKEAEEAGRGHRRLRRSRQARRGRLHGLRRRDRDAGSDGQRRPPRPRARPARPDAEPEDRHRDDGCREGRSRGEGRQARVPHRPRRERPHPDRQEELRRARSCSRTTRPCSTRSSARSRRSRRAATSRGSRSPARWAPGIHVDPARTRGIVDDLDQEAEAVTA